MVGTNPSFTLPLFFPFSLFLPKRVREPGLRGAYEIKWEGKGRFFSLSFFFPPLCLLPPSRNVLSRLPPAGRVADKEEEGAAVPFFFFSLFSLSSTSGLKDLLP